MPVIRIQTFLDWLGQDTHHIRTTKHFYTSYASPGGFYRPLISIALLLFFLDTCPIYGTEQISYSHTIVYNANGGTGAPASQIKTYGSITTLSSVMPTRAGYTFQCWNTSPDSSGTAYHAGDLYGYDQNGGTVTLYAIWAMDPYSHTIAYDANGGTGAPASQIKPYGTTLTLTTEKPNRTGYNFYCWNTSPDSLGTAYHSGDIYGYDQRGGIVTLYAIWTPYTHTVTYNANGGTGAPDSQIKTYGATISLHGIVPVRTGYTFTGWNTQADGSGISYTPGQDYGYDQNGGTITLYAIWKQNDYKVTYHANGGTSSASGSIYHFGETISLSPSASKSGYRFVGWATAPNASKPLTSLTMPDLATSTNSDYSNDWELTLYAMYTIQVSDVANHTYPSYNRIKEDEVYLMVWKKGTPSTYKTYPLTYTGDSGIMFYNYQLHTDLSAYVGNEAYGYQIAAYDNAGNYSILYKGSNDGTPAPDPYIPKKYLQTVNHYRYDNASGKWLCFDTTTELVKEGLTFTPQYVTPPAGFRNDHIDGAYVVSSAQTVNAYYSPYTYTLTFHPNGGSVSPASKTLYYGDYYGQLPTPSRPGYRFLGWYTAASDGTLINSSTKYTTTENTTVYAHWSINSYNVIYDYWTNGGNSVAKETACIPYNGTIDLSVKAMKNGWTFIGWNTNPEAQTGLSSLRMSDEDIVLYAIYKKDITATFVDGADKTTRSVTMTIYNRQTSCMMSIPSMKEITGWKSLGWSLSKEADAIITLSQNSTHELSENTCFYGCYIQEITLSYHTNGSTQTIGPQSGERFFNAFGNYKNPVFLTANALTLSGHSFVQWEELASNGNVLHAYKANETIQIDHSMILTAKWDQIPEIESYDRYFTLEDAQKGIITEKELLKDVIAADKEDGVLENGTAVTITDFDANQFTHLTSNQTITTTIRAEDSFGNTIEKQLSVHVTDTSVTISPRIRSVRFISSEYFINGTEFISTEEGGLEDTSIWITNKDYCNTLEDALSNTTQNEETWHFTSEELEDVKTFVQEHGYGTILEKDAMEEFQKLFGIHRQ